MAAMDAQNPYSPPQVADFVIDHGNPAFADLDDKALTKLYYRSCNVDSASVAISFSVVIIGIRLWFISPVEVKVAFCVLAPLYLTALIGIFLRTAWGRGAGIIICALGLINIPLGTLFGFMGLFAFIKAPCLFGPGRVTHQDLKAEFKLRKKARKGR